MRVLPLRSVDTVFIGGGTPGVLSARQMVELCEIVRQAGGNFSEWSVELAPSEVTEEKLKVLKDFGVTRISLGIQTFDHFFLKELGRNHPPEKALQAYELIRAFGFQSVNVDLLFGAPGQTLAAWEDDLRRVVELEPEHVSTYCLTFEEDTALFARLSKGEVCIDPEREATFYEFAWDYLPSCGYRQYEVSNYSLPGKECRHNLNTWGMNEWVGCGPSASSQFGGKRYRNIADLETWAKSLSSGEAIPREDEVLLETIDFARDAVLFGLRLNAGVNLDEVALRFSLFPEAFSEIELFLDQIVHRGLADNSGKSYYLKPEGRILTDAIMSELPDAN